MCLGPFAANLGRVFYSNSCNCMTLVSPYYIETIETNHVDVSAQKRGLTRLKYVYLVLTRE
jgi:hypothetical protein